MAKLEVTEFDFEDYWPSVDHTEEVTDKNEQ